MVKNIFLSSILYNMSHRRRFYSSSNPKLLEGTSGKLLDLNNGPIWDYGVPN